MTMHTTVPTFADLPREVVEKLIETSLRELGLAAEAVSNLPDRQAGPSINAMRRALAAYDALATEQPSAADLAFLAAAALDWEAGDSENFRPPATADELATLRARLQIAEQLIALRGASSEAA